MCLSVPGKIIEIEGEMAKVSIGGTIVNTGLQLIDDARVGDYVLVHTGLALQIISETEAIETFKLIEELQGSDDSPLI